MTDPTDYPDVVDYTTYPLDELIDGGRIEVCPACGLVGLAVRYTSVGNRHPARFLHRRPAYTADAPRVQQQQARDRSRQSEADSCYVDPAPRADGLTHEEASAVAAWSALVRHELTLLESAVSMGWYDRIEGYTVNNRLVKLRPLLAGDVATIAAIVNRTVIMEANDGR